MTGFLASVRSPEEARIALEAGATLIDAKNPLEGGLGALPPEVIEAIVTTVAGHAPVSATVGDLPLDDPELVPRIKRWETLELSYIKIGVFPPRSSTIPEALETLPAPSVPRIAVLLVDHAPPESLALDRLKAAGFSGVMLDTGRKGEERLRDYVPPAALQSFVEAAKAAGLIVGLAGRLRALDIAALAPLQPDYLGFRSALCYEEERSQSIDPMACRTIARELLAYTPVLLTE